jgi:putative SOS response-associated peptidase YedK
VAGVARRGTSGRSPLKSLLAPYPSDGLMCCPVGPRVGSVKNNDPSLVEPIDLP